MRLWPCRSLHPLPPTLLAFNKHTLQKPQRNQPLTRVSGCPTQQGCHPSVQWPGLSGAQGGLHQGWLLGGSRGPFSAHCHTLSGKMQPMCGPTSHGPSALPPTPLGWDGTMTNLRKLLGISKPPGSHLHCKGTLQCLGSQAHHHSVSGKASTSKGRRAT